jgi:hypothetical protein
MPKDTALRAKILYTKNKEWYNNMDKQKFNIIQIRRVFPWAEK